MRTRDLLSFGLTTFRRQKLRSFLTLAGVLIGCTTLTVSLSISLGIQKAIDEQFHKEENLRQITVFPSHDNQDESIEDVPQAILDVPGRMSEAKRERIRKLQIERWKRRNVRPVPQPLNDEKLAALRQIPHVIDVVAALEEYGRVYYEPNKQSSDCNIHGLPRNIQQLTRRFVQGVFFSDPLAKECIVHEYFLYRCGIHDDDQLDSVLGQNIRIELNTARRSSIHLLQLFDADNSNISEQEMQVLDKAWKLMPGLIEKIPLSDQEKPILLRALRRSNPTLKKDENRRIIDRFKIVGIIRASTKSDSKDEGLLDNSLQEADIILPHQQALELFLQLPARKEYGFTRAQVIVDHEDNIEQVVEEIKKSGLKEFSMGVFVQQVKRNVLLVGFSMDFISLVALFVAALGITNTMFTTVLERTREIGIMKSIGAKERQVLFIFLIEGTIIGFFGGVCGLGCGWLVSIPGDDYARTLMQRGGDIPPPETLFLFPIWLIILVPAVAMVMTTLAALIPARKAAHVEAVVALRHD